MPPRASAAHACCSTPSGLQLQALGLLGPWDDTTLTFIAAGSLMWLIIAVMVGWVLG